MALQTGKVWLLVAQALEIAWPEAIALVPTGKFINVSELVVWTLQEVFVEVMGPVPSRRRGSKLGDSA
jgi:hypothetical protein